jgi:hypothetical protein
VQRDERVDPSWINGALAEYEAHRAEVLSEAAAQQQTLALGATAVGILVAGGFNVWDDQLLASVAFLAAVPLLSVLILVQWAGRAIGLMRVGVYLEGLEDALRTAYSQVPPAVFIWEKTLAKARPRNWWTPHYEWNDFGALAVFFLLAAGSIALGAYRAYDGHEGTVVVVVSLESVVLLICALALFRAIAHVREDVRRDLEEG